MAISPEQADAVFLRADCLHDVRAVETALARMAGEIKERLADADPLVLVIMLGGVIPAGQLLPRLDFPLQLDYIHATRYHGTTRGGDLHWFVRPRADLRGRTVLLIDDIHDEGHTLAAIVDYCRGEGAAQVLSAVLVDKRHGRKSEYRADFVGLEVADRYVFGYGMDYKEYLRNAPGIYAAKEGDA